MGPKVSDLSYFGNMWRTEIYYNPHATREDAKMLARKITEILNICIHENRITVTPSWFGDGSQLLVRAQNGLHTYRNFMNSFATNLDATRWIVSFLAGEIDMNHLYFMDYIDEVRSFVCITCMAEIARGYGQFSIDNLLYFLVNVVKGKNYWSELKFYYPPALTYSEDTEYIPNHTELYNTRKIYSLRPR